MECEFCKGPGRYTCPRCGLGYCGLACYRKPEHERCSELFYKECVEDEMKLRSKEDAAAGDPAARRRMVETLRRLHEQSAEEADPDLDGSDLDSDDEDEISERMAGLDLENSDEVWAKLTADERREFLRLVENGEIEKMMPAYKPWWDRERPKVQEVGQEAESEKGCPAVSKSIVPLGELIKAAPSPLVKFNLLNVLYAYVYAHKYFSGDLRSEANVVESVRLCLALSDNLASSANYESAEEALESAATNVNVHTQWSVSPKVTRETKKDVHKVVRGPSEMDKNYYLLAAVSDLKELFELCIKALKKGQTTKSQDEKIPVGQLLPWKLEQERSSANEEPLKRLVVKRGLKKVEFYLSWVNECGGDLETEMRRQF